MYSDGYAGIFGCGGVSVMPSHKSGRKPRIGRPFKGEPVRSTERLKQLHAQGDFDYILMEGKQRHERGRCRKNDRSSFLRLVQFTDMRRLIIVSLNTRN